MDMNIELAEIIDELLKRLSALTYENIVLSKALEQMSDEMAARNVVPEDYSGEFISAPV